MPQGDPAGYLPNVLKARGRAAASVFRRKAAEKKQQAYARSLKRATYTTRKGRNG